MPWPEVSRREPQKGPGLQLRSERTCEPVFFSKPFSFAFAAETLFVKKGGWREGKKKARERRSPLRSFHRPDPRARFFFFFQLLLFLASTKERELFFGLSRKASPDKGRRGLPEDTMRRRIPYSRTPARQVLANWSLWQEIEQNTKSSSGWGLVPRL